MPILACEAPLVRLLRGLPGLTVVPKDQPLPDFDCWIDQMSLPHAFGTALGTIPAAEGYLTPDPALTAWWRDRLPPGPKVGLVWAGNSLHANDRRRSMPPSVLAPLLSQPETVLINLQTGPGADRLGLPVLSLTDFADTASVIANLDLVVTVDTAVAHLAGATGKPAWVMLPHAPDWRWLLHRADSPWYATLRLFRQAAPGDWPGVIQAVVNALNDRVRSIQLSSSRESQPDFGATRCATGTAENQTRLRLDGSILPA
jgi:hypothetical protein